MLSALSRFCSCIESHLVVCRCSLHNITVGEKGIDRRLLCCAPSAEARLHWIQVIRARTAKDTVIRSFSGFYQPPESRLQQRLRLARAKQWENQARALHQQPRADDANGTGGEGHMDHPDPNFLSTSSSLSSSTSRRPSVSAKPNTSSSAAPSKSVTATAESERCLFICNPLLVSSLPPPSAFDSIRLFSVCFCSESDDAIARYS